MWVRGGPAIWTMVARGAISLGMKTPRQAPPSQAERKDRLKSALKANIARRKAQAEARAKVARDAARAERDAADPQEE